MDQRINAAKGPPKQNMKLYGIHFLTHGNDIFAVEWVNAECDEAAKKQAERLRTGFGKGHEIWDHDRLVDKVNY